MQTTAECPWDGVWATFRFGGLARTTNAALGLAAAAVMLDQPVLVAAALCWLTAIGIDRALTAER